MLTFYISSSPIPALPTSRQDLSVDLQSTNSLASNIIAVLPLLPFRTSFQCGVAVAKEGYGRVEIEVSILNITKNIHVLKSVPTLFSLDELAVIYLIANQLPHSLSLSCPLQGCRLNDRNSSSLEINDAIYQSLKSLLEDAEEACSYSKL